jgi:hypothetical protein
VCENCHQPAMNVSQMNYLRRVSIDRYRELNNLLTSEQIIHYRENLGMSQVAFANYLLVGEASVKRWETYYIQDASQDDHIRIKCDEGYAESNYLNIQWKYSKPDIYTGKKRFSFNLFKIVTFLINKKIPDCDELLRTLHFYVDFLHFKRFEESITGNKYLPLKYGPNPYQFKTLYSNLKTDYLSKLDIEHYNNKINPMFDDREKQTIDDVCGFYLDNGEAVLRDFARREKGYLETPEDHPISYEFAKELLIS